MNENMRLMIKVARLYYESGLTQDVISQNLRLSRPKVSRLLQEARELGIVKISIAQEPGSYAELERELETRCGLLEAVVAEIGDPAAPEVVSRDLGVVAANYLRRVVQDGDVIGLTWGATLSAMVDSLPLEKKKNVVVMQLVGGLGEPGSETHATDLVHRLSLALGATLRLLPAPGMVGTIESAHLLRSDRYIAQALETMEKVDIAFVGIGAPTRDSLLMRGESIITWAEVTNLMAAGAVGDISLHFYDEHGRVVRSEVDERVIGISLSTLRSLSRVVGVAGGADKFNAILGAVRGRYINTLITDRITACGLLEKF